MLSAVLLKRSCQVVNDHFLVGDWVGYRECPIQPDWLLIYKVQENILVLLLARTGSHRL
ncbi:MAG: type II toxin-antitoxin system YafQ family toxin [Eubacteriaceae bacterium]|nr:type II toxin-antitoxin system YafQ family toxin [Eubacteriaceae bacterium]